ncbi:MAG: hypothetical protein CHACPFDD_00327 [Phycisphaerae bacterium]|nr:hypothetical protein [Phycisphaerae bacterium]
MAMVPRISLTHLVVLWTLRCATWAVLLATIYRLAIDPHSARLNGRITQMEIRFESQRAADALFIELELDRYFDPARFRLLKRYARDYRPPVWLQLVERTPEARGVSAPGKRPRLPASDPWGPYLWLDESGVCLRPPLAAYPVSSEDDVPPRALRLTGRNGQSLVGAIVGSPWTSTSERSVWIHRADRWVNVLRVMCDTLDPGAPVHGAIVESLLCQTGRTAMTLRWDTGAELFEIPATAEPHIFLARLPDQVGYRPPPNVRFDADVVYAFVEAADLPGLDHYVTAVAKAYGRDITLPQRMYKQMGDNAIAAGRLDDAVRIYQRAVELYPATANAYDGLAKTYEKRGQRELALTNYRLAVETGQRGGDPDTWNYDRNLKRLAGSVNDDASNAGGDDRQPPRRSRGPSHPRKRGSSLRPPPSCWKPVHTG